MRDKLEEIWREKKSMCYIAILAGIILISSILSYLAEHATRDYTQDKAAQMEKELDKKKTVEETEGKKVSETEKEPDESGGAVSFQQEEGEEAADGAEVYEKENILKEAYDRSLDTYRESFDTEIKGSAEDISAFLADTDREDGFRLAIADYIFSTFGNISVDSVNIKELLTEDDREISCRITISLGEEELPYICSYNKKLNFYSLYSPKELQ